MVSESLITDREASLFRIRFDNFPVGADPISVRVIDVSIYATLWVSDKVLRRPVELAQNSVKKRVSPEGGTPPAALWLHPAKTLSPTAHRILGGESP
jgi:hypothetical protein